MLKHLRANPDPDEADIEYAEKLEAKVKDLEAKQHAAKSPGKRTNEVSKLIFDNKEILRLRRASLEKQKATIAAVTAQAEEDEAKILEQEGKLRIHERQMEEI